jgi:hypothetical protein
MDQTDQDRERIETYVVNNRKRILKLLGFTNAMANLAPQQPPGAARCDISPDIGHILFFEDIISFF